VLPSGFVSTIKSIDTFNNSLDQAISSQSVTLTLEDDVDVSRGDMIVKENNVPTVSQDVDLMFCWFNPKPLQLKGKYVLRHTSNDVKCIVNDVKYKVNINSMERNTDDKSVGMNEIGRMSIRTQKPIFFDSYRKNRVTGSVILIDEATNETVCAGMIV
jgi:sulfate adenylyltransferase subunit 1